MSILKKGTDFGPTEQVTSTKLDNLVDAAKFTNISETAVPYTGSTGTCLQGGGLEVTSAGQLQVSDSGINTVKLADSSSKTTGVTFSKMQHISTAKVLGNVSGSEGDITEIDFKDEDDMSSDSATAVASQQSIKAYIASVGNQFFHLQQKNTSGSQSSDSLTINQYVKRSVVSQGNTITGASESSSVITLPAGTYEIKAFGMARTDGNGTTPHRLRLRNTSDNTTAILGGVVVTIGQSGLDNEAVSAAPLQGYITISGTKNFELQHYAGDGGTTGSSSVAGGSPVSSGESEVYADILIRKVD